MWFDIITISRESKFGEEIAEKLAAISISPYFRSVVMNSGSEIADKHDLHMLQSPRYLNKTRMNITLLLFGA